MAPLRVALQWCSIPMSHADGDSEILVTDRPRIEPSGTDALRVRAPAKINLNLLVGPRRPDGFHPLDSFVARVTLYDEIELRSRHDGRICFACTGADCGPDEQNLAHRAARVLGAESGRAAGGADIVLSKRIPAGSGLGGGSSDAAAVLVGLNELWGLSKSAAELTELALQLSSDAAIFFGPPTARMTGRGERIEPAAVHPFFAVVYLSDFASATAEVYAAFDRQQCAEVEQLEPELLADNPPSCWRGRLSNQLTDAAVEVCGELGELRRRLCEAAGLAVSMTGSGSAFFILCDTLQEARQLLTKLPGDLRERCIIVRQNPW